YQFVNSKEGKELDLARQLRRKKFRKLRKGRLDSTHSKKQKIPHRVSIDERPKVVGNRRRYGDWETDLMEGKRGSKHCLSVQKERKSQYVCLKRVRDKTAEENTQALTHNL